MFRRTVYAAVGTLIAAGSLAVTAPTASAATDCDASTTSWTCSASWGSSEGDFTGSGSSTHAKGWVKDKKSDSYCVQVVLTWYGSNGKKDTDYSPQACPNGDKDEFDKMPGDGTHWSPTAVKISVQKV
ncbi:hypothetical protein [Streptomyces sp. NPDC057002]|uniref:hypothetical protein n=1 Tax=Streptomyces sp. NPDC057002 TaxID=3345992 RepID=UPI00362512BC